MSSNIHALKNRPYLRPAVAEAFKSWELLIKAMKQADFHPEARIEIHVFLSWLIEKCHGDVADIQWLESIGIITDDDIIDWETSTGTP